jgi:hypothetical protein
MEGTYDLRVFGKEDAKRGFHQLKISKSIENPLNFLSGKALLWSYLLETTFYCGGVFSPQNLKLQLPLYFKGHLILQFLFKHDQLLQQYMALFHILTKRHELFDHSLISLSLF